ncbi:MAG: acyltransferase family protein [Solirubrobacterales bacterium]
MADATDTLELTRPVAEPAEVPQALTAPPRELTTRRLLTIDALRALAAISVMVHHLPPFTGPLAPLRPWQAIGFIGVGLFLVLSGFSVHYKWALKRDHVALDQRAFWRRRFTRLYPSYLVAAIIAAAVAGAAGAIDHPVTAWSSGDAHLPWAAAWASQALVLGANIVPVPVLFISWTIALEFQLYGAYAVVAATVRRFDPVKIVLWALAITLAWRLASQLVVTSVSASGFLPSGRSPLESRFLYSQMPARCFEWFLGLLAVEAFVGNVRLPRWTGKLVIPAALLLAIGVFERHPLGALSLNGHHFMLSDVAFDPLVGLAFFVLINWFVAREDAPLLTRRWNGRPLRFAAFLGLFSYSIYLVHETVFVAWRTWLGWHSPAAIVVEAIVAVFVSWLFYLAVERHFLKRGRRIDAAATR